jgi:hypothetical protein
VSPEERALLQTRLQAELHELRQRESLYVAKRKELQELELAFRKRMDQQVAIEQRFKEKSGRNGEILGDLKR